MAELAGTWAARVGADCDLRYHWPADRRPRRRDTRSTVAEAGDWFRGHVARLCGVALILAAFRVDVAMMSGGNPATWNGWVHGIAFLLIIAAGVLAPLTMALAVRRDPSWRPITVVSLTTGALFIVFLILPWDDASFLMAIVTLFGWMAALATRPGTHHS